MLWRRPLPGTAFGPRPPGGARSRRAGSSCKGAGGPGGAEPPLAGRPLRMARPPRRRCAARGRPRRQGPCPSPGPGFRRPEAPAPVLPRTRLPFSPPPCVLPPQLVFVSVTSVVPCPSQRISPPGTWYPQHKAKGRMGKAGVDNSIRFRLPIRMLQVVKHRGFKLRFERPEYWCQPANRVQAASPEGFPPHWPLPTSPCPLSSPYWGALKRARAGREVTLSCHLEGLPFLAQVGLACGPQTLWLLHNSFQKSE